VSGHSTDIVNPHSLVASNDTQENAVKLIESTTLDFARLALSVQVCLVGAQLPCKYLRSQWRSLLVMLLPGMLGMWMISALFIWAIVAVAEPWGPTVRMPFLHAMAIGACITPTDPVLSNTIVKGRWADKHVPSDMAQLISAESGANDGLGYPFLFLALYLIKYLGTGGYEGSPGDGGAAGSWGGARSAMGMWFGETWGYVILLSVVWGAVVGWVGGKCLKVTRILGYVSQENLFSMAMVVAVRVFRGL
jgi:NhaP-type Na+/H+ or K+/H+ antiporter